LPPRRLHGQGRFAFLGGESSGAGARATCGAVGAPGGMPCVPFFLRQGAAPTGGGGARRQVYRGYDTGRRVCGGSRGRCRRKGKAVAGSGGSNAAAARGRKRAATWGRTPRRLRAGARRRAASGGWGHGGPPGARGRGAGGRAGAAAGAAYSFLPTCLLIRDLWMWGMTPPPAMVALMRVSSSSSPRMASCRWRGVMRFTCGARAQGAGQAGACGWRRSRGGSGRQAAARCLRCAHGGTAGAHAATKSCLLPRAAHDGQGSASGRRHPAARRARAPPRAAPSDPWRRCPPAPAPRR
jgi:hypothetical protein